MSTLSQLRRGVSRALEQISEGWHYLTERASHALTRFNPTHSSGELETAQERHEQRAARWGLVPAEVSSNAKNVVVELEVPGMKSGDFDISVVDDMLVVQGEKRVESTRDEGRYHVLERAYGRFERAVPLPSAVDEESAKARYRKGVLTVTLPKAEHARTRRIQVEGQ